MPVYSNFRPVRRGILFREDMRRVHLITRAFNENRRRIWELEHGR